MKLSEIKILNNVPKDDEALTDIMPNQFERTGFKKIKNLESSGKFQFSLFKDVNENLLGVIKLGSKVVGSVFLPPLANSKHDGKYFSAYVTDATQILEPYRGQDLGYKLYKAIINSGIILVSSDRQSPGGMYIWKKLHADRSLIVHKFDARDDWFSGKRFSKKIKSTSSAYHDTLHKEDRLVAFKM